MRRKPIGQLAAEDARLRIDRTRDAVMPAGIQNQHSGDARSNPSVIGYLTSEYPKVSHSFIRREIAAVEALGRPVRRYALRGWNSDSVDPIDIAERARTGYLLAGHARAVAALLLLAVLRPLATLRAVRLLARFAHRSDRSLARHAMSLVEAALLARWIRRDRVAHLHVHFGTNPAQVAALSACWSGIPYSFTVHGPDEFDRPQAIKLALKAERAAFVVAITNYCASQLYRWMPPDEWHKVAVVHCGLNEDFLSASPAPLPGRARLACVARLSAQKGHLLLVDAIAECRRRGHEVDLVLVGDGELRGQVEDAIERAALCERVRITGWLGEDAVRGELARADALILPSFAEGLPIVIMEALALGRPVLASNVAAIADLVETGETGWLFAPGSVAATVAAIEAWLATAPRDLATLGQRGRDRVIARHDARASAARLIALFDRAARC